MCATPAASRRWASLSSPPACGPIDSAGRGLVVAHGTPIVCGGVLVHPGDIVFGDLDGLVVIPQAMEKEAIERAKVKVAGENQARNDLERGDLLRDVYDRYGIL